MNKVISLSLIAFIGFLTWQCTSDPTFEVTGQLIGAVNDTIEIQEMAGNNMNTVKMIYTDETGHFTFTDTADNPRFLFLKLKMNYISLLVLKGQDISISADLKNLNQTFSISGSHESELIWDLNKEMQSAAIELDSLAYIYNQQRTKGEDQEADDWFRRKYQNLLDQQKAFIIGFINLMKQIGKYLVFNRKTCSHTLRYYNYENRFIWIFGPCLGIDPGVCNLLGGSAS